MAITGSKGSQKSKETSAFNQSGTETRTLSDRAYGLLTGGMNGLKDKTYQGVTPQDMAKFQDPYQQDVVNASLDLAGQRDAVARAQQQSDFGAAGAFGDKRRGVYEAELAAQQGRDRAAMIAGLNSQGFGQARDAALLETQAANQYDLGIQDIIARLLGNLSNEGTATTKASGTGSATKKGTSMNLGFGFEPWGGSK